ncbi:MAG: glycosyltransferase [Lachnospiraceae bacterium]|jgi:glycosyltransferase involved in cell wall biosynthesis|nr:glycosyltransferase [Lachnospiraceae bacterium]
MSAGKISIIVPIYNIETYLRRCLNSIIAQTYADLEIILVNDGSTDTSGLICDEYAAQDERIIVIHQENGGLSAAWNSGLAVATGKYIGFVDGDDFIEPNMYELMLEAIVNESVDLSICRHWIDTHGDMLFMNSGMAKTTILTNEEALEYFISEQDKYRIWPTVWSKLFTREVVNGFHFEVGKTSQDIMYTTKTFVRSLRIAYLDSYLYHYNSERSDSITNQKSAEKRLQTELLPLRQRIAYLHEHGFSLLANKASYYFYRRMLFYHIEFMCEKNKTALQKLIQMMRKERTEIRTIYKNDWVKTGDRVRMAVFLFSPRLYYVLVLLYDSIVIPLRMRKGVTARDRSLG